MHATSKESMDTAGNRLHPVFNTIDARVLRVDEITGFDIYAARDIGTPPAVRHSGNAALTEEIRHRLIAEGMPLLVAVKQQEHYTHYIEKHLSSIVVDNAVSLEARTRLAHGTAVALLRNILREHEINQYVPKSKGLVADFLTLFTNEEKALGQLMKFMGEQYGVSTHSVNVFIFSISLAMKAGLGTDAIIRLGQGALFHDIGKRRISDDILNHKGKLTPEQWRIIHKHPEFGADILTAAGVNDTIVLDVTLHHHEKLNGVGYPDGLSSARISKWARICAIADIFDALTTHRSYNNAASSFDSLTIMIKEMTGEIDQELLRIFIKMIGSV